MADVTLQGYTQGLYDSDGVHSVPWPAGTAVGMLGVILVAPGADKKPVTKLPSGWWSKGSKSDGTSVWVKTLTAADIAGPITIESRIELLQVLVAAGVGNVSSGESVSVTKNGGAMLLLGWASITDDLTVTNKIHTLDVVNSSYLYKGNPRKYNAWFKPMPTAGTAYVDTNAGAFFALEILPRTTPLAPALVAPADSTFFDVNSMVNFQWRHNSASSAGAQAGMSLFVRPVGLLSGKYADAGTPPHGWSVVPTIQPNPNASWIAEAYFTSGDYLWSVATSEDGSTLGPYSVERPISFRAKPTLTCTVTGSELTRTVSWVPTITNGSQIWYRVRIVAAADATPDSPLHDTGIVSGDATAYVVPADIGWANGGSYKAWVEFGQTGGQQTDPAESAAFTVSWTPPDPPASVVFNLAARPITLTANGLAGRERLRVRYTAGGTAWTISAPITAASLTLGIPLATYGVPVVYEVATSQTISGVELWSDPVYAVATSWDRNCYLVADDQLSWIRASLHSDEPREIAQTNTIAYGLARPDDEALNLPFVDIGAEQGWTGTTTVKATSLAARDALLEFWRANGVFITRWPPEAAGGVFVDAGATRMARVSGARDERLAQVLIARHLLKFQWVQQ